jgi:hypothetical protein
MVYNRLSIDNLRPGCIKRCQVLVKVNTMSSDLNGGYLKLDLNQPIKWADFRLDALLADTMLTKLYTTGPKCCPANGRRWCLAKKSGKIF